MAVPIELGPGFPPGSTRRPTHMPLREAQLWERWSRGRVEGAERIFFDVRLGEGRPGLDTVGDALARMWTRLTQKRADVLVEWPDQVWLVEVRTNASASVFGRLFVYLDLLKRAEVFDKPIVPIIVSDAEDTDLRTVAENNNIRFEVA